MRRVAAREPTRGAASESRRQTRPESIRERLEREADEVLAAGTTLELEPLTQRELRRRAEALAGGERERGPRGTLDELVGGAAKAAALSWPERAAERLISAYEKYSGDEYEYEAPTRPEPRPRTKRQRPWGPAPRGG